MSVDASFLRIPIRNLLRQRTRTLASLCAISVGVACLIVAGGFVKDILFQLGEATIHSQTGHVQISSPAYWQTNNRSASAPAITNINEIKSLIASLESIDHLAARMNFVGMLNNGKRDLGVIGEGIEADQEAAIGSFLHFFEGRALQDSDQDGIVIGHGVARVLDVKVGDYVTLVATLAEGALNTSEFKVIGIFQSFSKEFDSRAVRIPLRAAGELIDSKEPHLLVLTLKETQDTNSFLEKVTPKLSGFGVVAKSWVELSDFYEKTVHLYDAQFGVLRLIVFLMVLLSVANSINMSLYERTREFGTVLALGSHPHTVFRQILVESLMLGVAGSVLGATMALVVSWGLSFHGIPMPPPPNANIGYLARIRLDSTSVLISVVIGIVSTIFAAILPARRASRLPIIDALRHGV